MIIREMIARLAVKADTNKVNQFSSSVEKSKTKMKGAAIAANRLKGSIKKMTSSLGAYISLAAATMVFKKVIFGFSESADHALKFAQATGIASEAYQQWVYVAGLGGVEGKDLEKTLGQLTSKSYDAAKGMKVAVEAFKELGVGIKDDKGQLKSANQLLLEISDTVKDRIDDPKLRGALQKIFGMKGAQLIPMLKDGSVKIKELFAEAKKLGFILTPKQLKVAADFNDAVLRIKMAFRGLRNQLALEFMPTMIENINKVVEWIKTGDNLKRLTRIVKSAFKSAAIGVGLFTSAMIASKIAMAAAHPEMAALVIALGAVVYLGKQLYNVFQGKDSIFSKIMSKEELDDLRKSIKSIVSLVKGMIKEMLPVVKQLKKPLMLLFKNLIKLLPIFMKMMKVMVLYNLTILISAVKILNAVFSLLSDAVVVITELFEEFEPELKKAWETLKELVPEFEALYNWLSKLKLIDIMSGIFKGLDTTLRYAVIALSAFAGFMFGWYEGLSKRFKQFDALTGFTKHIKILVKALRITGMGGWSLLYTSINRVYKALKKLYDLYKKMPGFLRKRFFNANAGASGVVGADAVKRNKALQMYLDIVKTLPKKKPVSTPIKPGMKGGHTSIDVGGVTVAINGTTDMKSPDVVAAVKKGTKEALNEIVSFEYFVRAPAV